MRSEAEAPTASTTAHWKLVLVGAWILSSCYDRMGDRPPWWPRSPHEPQRVDESLFCKSLPKKSTPDPRVRRPEPAKIQAVVKAHYDRFQRCYGQALGRDPEARGNVTVRFAI